jgi:hypothetical protein
VSVANRCGMAVAQRQQLGDLRDRDIGAAPLAAAQRERAFGHRTEAVTAGRLPLPRITQRTTLQAASETLREMDDPKYVRLARVQ